MDTEKPDMLVGIDFGMTYTGRLLLDLAFANRPTRYAHTSLRCCILETTNAGASCADEMAWKNVTGYGQSAYRDRVQRK